MPVKATRLFNVDDFNGNKEEIYCAYKEIVTCPCCHYAIVPRILHGYYVEDEYGASEFQYVVSIAMFCTKCRRVFLAEYGARRDTCRQLRLLADAIIGLYPFKLQTKEFSSHIAALSPMFVETYSQSEAAQTAGLVEIAGCGYRKSIEYLIKDYLCHKDPSSSETIRGEFLGKSIQRIEDPRIKVLAERATWIGNDETHYVRKHEELDVEDMIRFVGALLNYVESELTFEEALSISPER